MPDLSLGDLPIPLPPLAHQREFVEVVTKLNKPARLLLSSPPGAGKSATLGFLAAALKSERGGLRCIAIVPQSLAMMWEDQLLSVGGLETVVMTPQTYRRLQSETGGNVNVWSTVSCAVVSIDFLKSADRIDEVLAAKWDLAILDDVHHATDTSQRGELARRIWDNPRIEIAVAATGLPNHPEWIAAHTKTKKIHWNFGAILGKSQLPQRRIHTITYTASETERQVATLVADLVRQTPKNELAQFTAQLLLRRLGSSMYALEQTLRRLLTVQTFGDTDLNDWTSDDVGEDADDAALANSFRIDRATGEQILTLLEGEQTDSKWECCFELLSSREIGKSCSAILFTDYADTAKYLEYLAKSRGLNVFLITGGLSFEARQHALRETQSNPALLIATAAVEGMNFTFTNQVIHYDIPWNPRAMEQRIGRVERVGSQFEMFDHYYIVEQNAALDALARLMEKVQAIEQEWK